jgi:hypothetical protein
MNLYARTRKEIPRPRNEVLKVLKSNSGAIFDKTFNIFILDKVFFFFAPFHNKQASRGYTKDDKKFHLEISKAKAAAAKKEHLALVWNLH